MRVSLVIAAHNEGESLWKTVRSCEETCAGLDHEVVIADDASWDGSVEQTRRRFPRVRVVRHEERQGTSPAKDLGARQARGAVLVFLDGHSKPERGALLRLVEDVERLKGQAVITPTVAALDVRRWRNTTSQVGHGYFLDLEQFHCGWLPLKELRAVQDRERRFYESPALIGCAVALHRELYEDLGGFDPHMRYWGVEDLDLGLRCWLMGHPILHDPEAVVGHRFRQGFDTFDVPLEHFVANQLRMARKNFTAGVWSEWVDRCRQRYEGRLAEHPEGLWARIWQVFEQDRPSAEEERAILHARRVRDEFWYAERFALRWPRLQSAAGAAPGSSAPLPPGQPAGVRAFQTEPSPSPSPAPPRPEPDPEPPCEDDEECCECGCSEAPVRYFNGEVQLAVTDLSAGGYGKTWQQRRVYSNQLSSSADLGNGYNWLVEPWPYLVEQTDGSMAVVRGVRKTLWFDLAADGGYTGRYGAKSTLTHDAANQRFVLTTPSGEQWRFHDFGQTASPQGLFAGHVAKGGQLTEVTSYTAAERIAEIQRSVTSGGSTTTDSFLYQYESGGRAQSVTWRRQVGGGAWTGIRRVLYEYYAGAESFGSAGDLKQARIQVPQGTAWADSEIHYYRYYQQGDALGFVHGLKYAVGPQAYARMTADGLDPLTAGNAQVAQYADQYLEYDIDRRVTKEAVDGGSRVYTFAYATSGHPDGYNNWKRKTVETRPDGSQHVVYTNFIGQILIKELRSGTNRWIEYRKYNLEGREIERATPSAVTGYDDSFADLNVSLKANDGLIHVTNYYTTTGAGAAQGYVQFAKIKRGSAGTEIKLQALEYAAHSAGSITVYPVSKRTVYRNEDGSGAIETNFSYTWHSGTVQMQERVMTLPAVPASQNGSGISATRRGYFDVHANLTWQMDERGFLTRFQYDVRTGAVVQRIDDVDTAQVSDAPAGWTTPAGGGLHLVTDYEHDHLGRQTQELGPAHTIDRGGTVTIIRQAIWTVYQDVTHEIWVGRGSATGTAPSYTYTLINPVAITKRDRKGNTREEIQAVRSSTAGRLQPLDSFPQSSYVRWTTYQYTDCCLAASLRVYHAIPDTGEGARGINYDETQFGYDALKRRNRTASPGGTITFDVLDVRGQTIQTYVGTDDAGATEDDPTGGGAPGNNMVLVTEDQYDNGSDGGDGNLTQVTQHVNATETRVTAYQYDWRNRRMDTDGEVDVYQRLYYDNLDRVVRTERYDTTASGNLISRDETKYDERDRAYRTIRYGVDPATGTIGNSLTDNTWYDAAGSPIKSLPAGAKLFTKTVFDSLNRPARQYVGYDLDESTYAESGTVAGDTILEQTETTYDAAGNVVQTTRRQRYHDAAASETGPLNGPAGPVPKARVSYLVFWHDALGREFATADYGTNGGTALTRPQTVPTRSDTTLVTTAEYNSRGEAFKTIDPAAKEDRTEFDDAGREVRRIENYVDGDPTTGTADQDRTTLTTYAPDGGIATQTAVNPSTGDQMTRYVYGTTLADSDVARSDLLRAEIYPDSDDTADPLGDGPDGVYDRIEYKYNRQGEQKEIKDQNGTVRAVDYDKLGRQTQDRVTTLGSGVGGAVRRIATTYEVRGLREKVTSYDNPTIGTGSVVNEVQFAHDNFAQLVTEYQAHSGAVNTASTPKVQYGYADGSANTIRPTSVIYPDGRQLDLDYGTAGGIGDAAGRIRAIKDGTLALVQYAYLGQGAFVEADYTEPAVKWTLVDLTGNNDPDTGDIYSGLDRFGRVKDNRWYDYGASADADRIKYGHDRAGNRLWREVPLDPNDTHDELYGYDGLYRLDDFDRGALNAAKDTITVLKFAQQWLLDATGNWSNFKQDDNGDGTWDLDQGRTANRVNEITGISETAEPAWATPAYSRAGNMVTLPQPADPTASYAAAFDAWNRLVKLTEGASIVQEDEYDGLRRRTVRRGYAAGSLDENRHFYYSDNWQVLEERLDASTNPDRQFVWGLRYIDDLVCRDRDTTGDGTLDERLYALQDANWNVTAVIDTVGDVQERFAYQAYGEPLFLDPAYAARAGSSFAWETLFAGYRWDENTGMYIVRNRILHMLLGTWGQRDPDEYIDSLNLYQYIRSNPMLGTDPTGRDCCDDCDTVGASRNIAPSNFTLWPALHGNPNIDEAAKSIAKSVKLITKVIKKLPAGKIGKKIGKVYDDAIDAALDAAKPLRDKLRRHGVVIFVKVQGDCCREVTCWPYFWTTYKTWVRKESDWQRCSEKGNGRAIGFEISDKQNLAEALKTCLARELKDFSCK